MSNLNPSDSRQKTRYLVQLAMWTALTLLLAFIPNIGYIPIGPFTVTIVHLPVIIGAIMLGPLAGAFLGFVMGITSVIQATMIVPITAFMFSPFVPFGNGWSLVVAILPRIFIGLVAAYLFRLIKRKDKHGYIAALAAGIAGSLTNTILVLGLGALLFTNQFASANGISVEGIFIFILGTIAVNGVIEAVVAAVASTAVSKALFAAMKRI